MKKNFWDEDEENTLSSISRPTSQPKVLSNSAEVDQKIHDTKILMEQTHQLYQQYFSGVEKRPPIEKARLLESKVKELERAAVTMPTAKFKLSQFVIQYKTFRDLWDRKLRDKEKI